ncbi:MAG TPA: hypothetical protein VHX65_17690 [Pirellulales bacterium]|nr:hypothetical protein [Pirellulales bacterium]
MREKLAWAEAHGIEPPAFVREAAAEEARADAANSALHDALRGKKHCCSCCCGNCQRAISAAPAAPQKPSAESLPPPDGKSVIFLMALGCHGQSVLSILAQALPAIVLAVRRYEFLPLANVCICRQSFESIRFSPPVPPPERSAAAYLRG